ncbi:MAG TPA: acetyl-CoA carboxylase biotin carboxyl carrier protein [Bacteroidetes bacterium]|nr:acetyl-CoA carboxylase biotin carboxyl carrier protein [Bacteroidota bacterium]
MTFQEIIELIKTLSKSRLAEFKMKDGDFELSIKTDRYKDTKTTKVISAQVPAPLPVAPPAAAPPPTPPAAEAPAKAAKESPAKEEEKEDASKYLEIKSPMVGTFYRSPSPEKPPYVEVGKTIHKGDVVCVIEAMKLFNEIEAEVDGKIVKVLVDNAKPVEYDQVLFLVEPA